MRLASYQEIPSGRPLIPTGRRERRLMHPYMVGLNQTIRFALYQYIGAGTWSAAGENRIAR